MCTGKQILLYLMLILIMANKTGVDLKQLKKDIVEYHKKRQKAYAVISKGYPRNYQEIADKYINPKTGEPLTRQYIMILKRRLVKEGKIIDIDQNLGI